MREEEREVNTILKTFEADRAGGSISFYKIVPQMVTVGIPNGPVERTRHFHCLVPRFSAGELRSCNLMCAMKKK